MRSTPHINPTAPIAETILLPGDPLRAKFIAENYLEDVQQFNAVRNMLGFTGTYQGTPVSVMGTGMGIPSISLYSYELIHEFGCKRLVRIGTCGALQPDMHLYDVVVAQAACSNSAFVDQYQLPGTYAPIGSFRLIEEVVHRAREASVPVAATSTRSGPTISRTDTTWPLRAKSSAATAIIVSSRRTHCPYDRSVTSSLGATATRMRLPPETTSI